MARRRTQSASGSGVLERLLAVEVRRAARVFPAVVVTGPRRAGKTTLLRSVFPDAAYHLLEAPDVLMRLAADPRSFVGDLRPPVILDEIQNAPELFSWIRARIDAEPERRGGWLLTGSRDIALMEGVAESMAGRAAILKLLPFSSEESPSVTPFSGGYFEVLAHPEARRLWFESYLQTYLERDLRAITAVRDLATFRRFLGLLATRNGQVLNRSDRAAPLGVSVPTISQWIATLEVSGLVALVPAWYENLGQRIVKSPKLHFLDTGLVCHLLGFATEDQLRTSPLHGAIFESFVASEILKHQTNAGRRPDLLWYRDQRGLEVDFVVPGVGEEVFLIEAKATRTPHPAMADPLLKLAADEASRDPLLPRPCRRGRAPARAEAGRPGGRPGGAPGRARWSGEEAVAGAPRAAGPPSTVGVATGPDGPKEARQRLPRLRGRAGPR